MKPFLILAISFVPLYVFSPRLNAQSQSSVEEFVDMLDSNQKESLLLSFDDSSREFWSYLPGAMMPRPGIRLDALNEQQRVALHRILRTALSEAGYEEVEKIINLESILAEMESRPDFRDPLKYSIVFYGNPFIDKAWSWSFQGHHLSLHFSYVDGKISGTPRFLGASPRHVHKGEYAGQEVLKKEVNRAFDLLQSMDKEQLDKAIFKNKPYMDIVTVNAMEVQALGTVGIKASELNKAQQTMLDELIYAYLDVLPMQQAISRIERIRESSPADIYFAWAGKTDRNEAYYYRIQGKDFLVEFDCTFGDPNHVHTVWRDFNGDFGRDLLREHYNTTH